MDKIIVIVGPTASGKSHLAIELAKKFNGEIINGDAFHVYKQLAIGTNKPSEIDMKTVPHHLFSFINIDETWNVKIFQKQTRLAINDILKRKKVPIICGGTGLYIDAVIKDYKFHEFEFKNDYSNLSNEEIWKKIEMHDEEILKKLSINNRRRLESALNLIENFKIKKSDNDNAINKYMYDIKIFFLNPNREELKIKIKARMMTMLNNGWKNEVDNILKEYPNFLTTQASKALGYSELATNTLDESDLAKKTILYAKRQVTWFKNKNPIVTHTINDFYNASTCNQVENLIIPWITGKNK